MDIYDVFERQTPELSAYMNSFDEIPHVDLTADWWNRMVSDTYTIGVCSIIRKEKIK